MLHANAPLTFVSSGNICGRLVEFFFKPHSDQTKPHAARCRNTKSDKRLCATEAQFQLDASTGDPISEALEHRRTVVEMVAHDLRSPVMSALVSLALVEEFFLNMSQEGVREFESAYENLEKTLQRIQELLYLVRDPYSFPGCSVGAAGTSNYSDAAGRVLQLTHLLSFMIQQLRMALLQSDASLRSFSLIDGSLMTVKAKAHLQRSATGIERGLRLIDEYPEMESLHQKKLTIRKSPCSIALLADEAIDSMKELASQRGISLINSCTNEVVDLDGNRIIQVLCNYLSNSINASAENTKVCISNQMIGPACRLEVKDEGPGILSLMGTRKDLFEKSGNANQIADEQVHGIGLSICRLIARAHGGQVGAFNEETGSTFWIQVPGVT